MSISFDVAAAERTEAARAIFAKVDADGYSNLAILSGADLCMFGGPKHPFFWEPLAAAWLRLRPREQKQYIKARTNRMIEAGWLFEESPGNGYHPGARFKLSPELGILLAARCRPTFVIAAHFNARIAPLSLFAIGDEAKPVRGIVMAVPVLARSEARESLNADPLRHAFDHLLTTPAHAAGFLADWTLTPAPTANPYQEHPAYLVSLFRPGEVPEPGGEPAGNRLSVLGNGTTAYVTGPGPSGEFDKDGLRTIMLNLIDQGLMNTLLHVLMMASAARVIRQHWGAGVREDKDCGCRY